MFYAGEMEQQFAFAASPVTERSFAYTVVTNWPPQRRSLNKSNAIDYSIKLAKVQLDLSRKHLVHVAPYPALAWLNRTNERVRGAMEMFGGMLVF